MNCRAAGYEVAAGDYGPQERWLTQCLCPDTVWSSRAMFISDRARTKPSDMRRYGPQPKKETPVGGDRGLWGSSLLSRQRFWSGGNQNGQGGSALTNNDASKPVGTSESQESAASPLRARVRTPPSTTVGRDSPYTPRPCVWASYAKAIGICKRFVAVLATLHGCNVRAHWSFNSAAVFSHAELGRPGTRGRAKAHPHLRQYP